MSGVFARGAQQTGVYYVYDGKNVQRVDKDPANVVATSWQMWFFRAGSPTSPPSAKWGSESGDTAAEVIELTRKDQQIELDGNGTFGQPRAPSSRPGALTYFNYLGPIAVIWGKPGSSSAVASEKVAQARGLAGRATKWLKTYTRLRDRLAGNSPAPSREGNRGIVLGEYAPELVQAAAQVHELEHNLRQVLEGDAAGLDNLLSAGSQLLTQDEELQNRIATELVHQGAATMEDLVGSGEQTPGPGRPEPHTSGENANQPVPQVLSGRQFTDFEEFQKIMDGMGLAATEIYEAKDPNEVFQRLAAMARQLTPLVAPADRPLRQLAEDLVQTTAGQATPDKLKQVFALMEAIDRELQKPHSGSTLPR